jgi:membrane protease YdiL (CAAX protease family)
MGFHGWGYPLVYLLALAQGVVYNKTNSLTYLIAIHWMVDLVLVFLLIRFSLV